MAVAPVELIASLMIAEISSSDRAWG